MIGHDDIRRPIDQTDTRGRDRRDEAFEDWPLTWEAAQAKWSRHANDPGFKTWWEQNGQAIARERRRAAFDRLHREDRAQIMRVWLDGCERRILPDDDGIFDEPRDYVAILPRDWAALEVALPENLRKIAEDWRASFKWDWLFRRFLDRGNMPDGFARSDDGTREQQRREHEQDLRLYKEAKAAGIAFEKRRDYRINDQGVMHFLARGHDKLAAYANAKKEAAKQRLADAERMREQERVAEFRQTLEPIVARIKQSEHYPEKQRTVIAAVVGSCSQPSGKVKIVKLKLAKDCNTSRVTVDAALEAAVRAGDLSKVDDGKHVYQITFQKSVK